MFAVDAQFKCCPRCNSTLPLDDFGISRARKDGRNIYCKRCNRDRTNASRQSARERQKAQLDVRAVSSVGNGSATTPGPIESIRRFEMPCSLVSRASVCLTPVERVREAIRSGPKTQREILELTRLSKDEIGEALADLLLWMHEVGTKMVGDTRLYYLKAVRIGDSDSEMQGVAGSEFDRDETSFSSMPFFAPGKPLSRNEQKSNSWIAG